jgi:hypothetical protein
MRDLSRLSLTLLPLLLAQSHFLGVASARTFYVDKNAPGPTHDGASWSTALLTIQPALDAASMDDEVWVAASAPASPAYFERVTLVGGVGLYGGFSGTESSRAERDPKKNVTILDGRHSDFVVVCPSHVMPTATIDGFTIRNGYASMGAGVNASGQVRITNNIITANQASEGGGGIRTGSGTITISNNVISDNTAPDGGGVFVYGGAIMTNNLITGNTATRGAGIYSSGAFTGAGNTIIGNTAPSGGALVYNIGAAVKLYNSIIAHNSSGILRVSGTLDLRNCDVFGNAAYNFSGLTDPTGTNGNISQDPLFVDRPGGNYRLPAGSPCVDTGDDTFVKTGETDMDGKPRILGAHVDMGCYEYGTVGPPPYTLGDVSKCLSIGCGASGSTPEEVSRLNVDSGDAALNLRDALRIARKVAGLEPNP